MSKFTDAVNAANVRNSHYIIDGEPFASIKQLHSVAKGRGCLLELGALQRRISRGATTWEEIMRPVNANLSAAGKTTAKRKRVEMAELIAALDQRKRDMGIES